MSRQTSTINYYANINLTKDYSNVCDKIDLTTISNYLKFNDADISVIKHNLTNGSFRINRNINQLSYINYLAILNNSGDRSVIYAFLDNVEFIAENVSEVTFTIDLFTTYCQSLDYQDCFIKRMTVGSDTKYSWVQDENIDGGDYVVNSTLEDYTVNWNYGYSATTNNSGTPVNGQIYDNVFSAAKFTGYTAYGPVVEDLQYYTSNGYIDNVCNVVQYPRECGTDASHVVDVKYISLPSTIDGYTPKNNKLFNYPYVRGLIVTSDGDSLELKPELSSDSNNRFQYRKDVMVIPIEQIVITVGQYKGMTASNNKLERLFITGFPEVTWASDNYRAWLARNKPSRDYQTASVLGTVVGNALSGNTLGTVESLYNGANTLIQQQVSNETNKMQGQTIHKGSNLGVDVAQETFGSITYIQTIKSKQAELIDNYFNAYGYAINKVTYFEPSRTRFDYVQTSGNLFRRKSEGNGVPQIAIDTINNACNSGIRIWHSVSELNRGNLVDSNAIVN